MENNSGLLVVLSGPSGVGKGTVAAELLSRGDSLTKSISATTRAPRDGEINGESYYFVSQAQFESMAKAGNFLENFEIFGNRYGTPKEPVLKNLDDGRDVLLEIDVQGGLSVKKAYPEAVLIFLLPPSMQQLETRLRGRKTEDEQSLFKRLMGAATELDKAKYYDYIVINQEVKAAADEVMTIIQSEKHRAARMDIKTILGL